MYNVRYHIPKGRGLMKRVVHTPNHGYLLKRQCWLQAEKEFRLNRYEKTHLGIDL